MDFKMKNKLTTNQKIRYEKIIEDATVDCKDEDEQISGWESIFENNIITPCKCIVGKDEASLEEIRQDEHLPSILGVIRINNKKIRTPIQDIVLEDSNMNEYIEAYKYWMRNW